MSASSNLFNEIHCKRISADDDFVFYCSKQLLTAFNLNWLSVSVQVQIQINKQYLHKTETRKLT